MHGTLILNGEKRYNSAPVLSRILTNYIIDVWTKRHWLKTNKQTNKQTKRKTKTKQTKKPNPPPKKTLHNANVPSKNRPDTTETLVRYAMANATVPPPRCTDCNIHFHETALFCVTPKDLGSASPGFAARSRRNKSKHSYVFLPITTAPEQNMDSKYCSIIFM